MIAVSACLMGMSCRYNGSSVPCMELEKLMINQNTLLFCPEVMGGFSTPREPAEIIQGTGHDVIAQKASVRDRLGKDVTEQMILGATCAKELILQHDVMVVVLKDKSPSCGLYQIHDGSFSGKTIKGHGILPSMLKDVKVPMYSENEIKKIKSALNKHERVGKNEWKS